MDKMYLHIFFHTKNQIQLLIAYIQNVKYN